MGNTFFKIAAILGAGYVIAGLAQPKLKNFSAGEFGLFYPLIEDDLLYKLDELREQWGRAINISPVEGAVGRVDEHDSEHNIIKNLGVTRAVDVFPVGSTGGSMTQDEAEQFVALSRAVGFTGIGVYTDTIYKNRPWIMVHLDVRINRTMENPALWSRVDGNYLALERAFL